MAFVGSFTGIPLARATHHATNTLRPVRINTCKQTRMSLAPIAQNIALKANDVSLLVSVKDGDFGGYTGPIIGLLIIGIIIAVLTPPVKE